MDPSPPRTPLSVSNTSSTCCAATRSSKLFEARRSNASEARRVRPGLGVSTISQTSSSSSSAPGSARRSIPLQTRMGMRMALMIFISTRPSTAMSWRNMWQNDTNIPCHATFSLMVTTSRLVSTNFCSGWYVSSCLFLKFTASRPWSGSTYATRFCTSHVCRTKHCARSNAAWDSLDPSHTIANLTRASTVVPLNRMASAPEASTMVLKSEATSCLPTCSIDLSMSALLETKAVLPTPNRSVPREMREILLLALDRMS
mmetsp:Transcript_31274/g.99748  ORF Transcript_31274/g.99748 Transcript_31274/m.99748 type:complete len:258 (-) Transcript_31274:1725-2498(-)